MAYMINTGDPEAFRVVHPLYDVPEAKCDVEGLGPMHMTPSVKVSLFVLRAYLIVMVLLVLYRFLVVARVV